jgi:hypothetical protein
MNIIPMMYIQHFLAKYLFILENEVQEFQIFNNWKIDLQSTPYILVFKLVTQWSSIFNNFDKYEFFKSFLTNPFAN